MAMSDARYKLLGGGQYPSECDEDDLVPHALPVPFCRCEPGNQLAEVKQSRHPKTAGRAFYICKWNDSLNPCHCFFFQWIDGPDKFDPRIRLFPYYRSESWAYNEFRRWVPPPPNPPPMTEEEKQEAAIYCVNNPPKCHCSVRAKLQRPNIGVPPKFTLFFRCSLKTREVREFESGKKPWPCTTTPSFRCKCGIMATKGVVPSELGYGYYCGNSYGEYWEGKTCDWEWFQGRDTINRKLKIRKDYQVTLPLESFLSGTVLQDLRREYGKKAAEKATLKNCIVYWRRNRSKYPRPLTDRELLANYEKKKKEEEMESQRLREEREKKGFTVDTEAKYRNGSWEEYFQKLEANKRIEEMEKMEDLAQEAQMEAMQALVADLPHKVPNFEKKGKAVVKDDGDDDDDGWGELLIEGDSD
ncbi:hypothetical protein PVAP13_3KG487101 [Panicum virgatum]|uniref:GRF-type domain-containing protein n=1 Tax=Panicum virgatum TaxID=38727 RepID=A0A8T0V7T5_PANVG|nr:hypothetical protein PVAP13_3KG487101 [Panicum virgatum]